MMQGGDSRLEKRFRKEGFWSVSSLELHHEKLRAMIFLSVDGRQNHFGSVLYYWKLKKKFCFSDRSIVSAVVMMT